MHTQYLQFYVCIYDILQLKLAHINKRQLQAFGIRIPLDPLAAKNTYHFTSAEPGQIWFLPPFNSQVIEGWIPRESTCYELLVLMTKLLPSTVLFWWLFQTFPGCPRHGQRLIHSLKSASAATTSFLENLPWKSKMARKQNYFSRVVRDWNCTLVPCNTSTRNLFKMLFLAVGVPSNTRIYIIKHMCHTHTWLFLYFLSHATKQQIHSCAATVEPEWWSGKLRVTNPLQKDNS